MINNKPVNYYQQYKNNLNKLKYNAYVLDYDSFIKIISIDPTANEYYKGNYFKWIIQTFQNELKYLNEKNLDTINTFVNEIILNKIQEWKDLLLIYHQNKSKYSNINKCIYFDDLYKIIIYNNLNNYYSYWDKLIKDYQIDKDYILFYEDNDWIIPIIGNYELNKKLLAKTNYCNAKNLLFFNNNIIDSPIYIIIPKNPEYNNEIYQLKISSNELKDITNKSVKLKKLDELIRRIFNYNDEKIIIKKLKEDKEVKKRFAKINLLYAINKNKFSLNDWLKSNDPNSYIDEDNNTLLHYLIQLNKFDKIKKLIDKIPNLNLISINKNNLTPLDNLYKNFYKNYNILKLFINNNIQIPEHYFYEFKYIIVVENNKKGLLDKFGNIVEEIIYDEIYPDYSNKKLILKQVNNIKYLNF